MVTNCYQILYTMKKAVTNRYHAVLPMTANLKDK